MPGKLYVIATPIGNLSDISKRMAEALAEADVIAAEDTRVTRKLLSHLGISKPLISCHRHNELSRIDELIARMANEGQIVALTSDAGTPAISDPGHALVAAAWAANIQVIPICGPSAITAALSVSGYDCGEFAFYGFLPREAGKLRDKLRTMRSSGIHIAVIFESPRRVVSLMTVLAGLYAECRVTVCCDLTKYYELITRGSAEEALEALKQNPNAEKGEYCVVIDFSSLPPLTNEEAHISLEALIFNEMINGSALSEAASRVIGQGHPRNQVYRAQLNMKKYIAEVK
jgi:16S rRNA (cytidine1402-2'-O)-methyltransferase